MIRERILPALGSMTPRTQASTGAGGTAAQRRAWPWFAGVCVLLWLALFQVQTAQAAVAFVDSATATANANTLSIARPTGTLEGHLMLATLAVKDDVTITAPTGWTLIDQGDNDGDVTLAVFYKFAGSAAADPGPYTFILSSSKRVAGAILSYSGVDPNNPIDVAKALNSDGNTTTPTAPCVTTSYDDAQVIRVFGQRDGEIITAVPAGTTSRINVNENDDALLGVADAPQTNAGTTGNGVFTTDENKPVRAATIVLVPENAQIQTPIVFESSAENTAPDDADSITIDKPAGTVEGDLLLATLSQRNDNDFTAPSGWELYNQGTNGSDVTLAIFYKVAGASEPASYTFAKNDDSGRAAVGTILRYSGVDVDNPIDPTIAPASAVANGSSRSPTAPDVTTTFADTRVVRVFGQREMNTGIQEAPSCTVNRAAVNSGGQSHVGVADAPQYLAGATGPGEFWTDRNRAWRAATVVLVPQQVKLDITKTATVPTVSAGETISYSITVDNIGRGAASGVSISDTLPAGFSFVSTDSGTCGTGPIAGATGTVTWGTCTIADSASLTIAYTVAVAAGTVGGVYANTAVVDSTETDPVSDSANVTVLDADLAIIKTVSNPVPTEGETLVFTVTVTNNGGGTATNVVVTDTLPTGVTWVSTGSTLGTCSGPDVGGIITCDLGTLANGASATITITVTVNAGIGSPGMITNTASVSADQHDPLADNDTASVTATSCPVGHIQNIASVTFAGIDPVDANNTSSVCTELTFAPAAVVLGAVELRAMTVSDFLMELGVDGLSREALLELLGAWDPAAAAALVGADRAAILAALRNYLDPDGDGQVAVMYWETLEQRGTVGFFVEREQSEDWVQLNAQLLPALVAAPMGAEYFLADPTAQSGESYHYRLIELEAVGTTREYGPFRLQFGD